ncbi:MAG: CopD family protein [Bacteroidales bacterium]
MLAVLLRALTLAFQCGMVGGAVFALAVADKHERPRILRMAALSAVAAAVASAGTLAVQVWQLMAALDLGLDEALGAGFVLHHLGFIGATLATAALCRIPRPLPWLAVITAALSLVLSVRGGHAASRVDGRMLAMTANWLHQLAAGVWLGGIPFLLLAMHTSDAPARIRKCRRFSMLAIFAVTGLVLSAAMLAVIHVGSWAALAGSDFGAMVMMKLMLLGGLLLLGFGNLRAGPHLDQPALLARLRAFATAEIAIGFAVLVVAASLASQAPPAG